MKKLLLFDHDGVLVETEQWYFQANKEILKSIGITLSDERYMEIMINGKSAMNLAKEYGYSDSEIEELLDIRNARYQEYLKTKNLKIPGVTETLEKLKPHFKMAIVTTSLPQDFAIIHKQDTITKYMDKIFTRNHYKKAKPHPDPYLKALESFNIDAMDAIVIEDSERGLRSAVNANIDCVIIRNHFTVNHDFSKAIEVLDDISSLPDYLLN